MRDKWLPRLSPSELDVLVWHVQLSLSGPDRTATPQTKAAKLELLARRRRTETLKAILRSAFLRKHKTEFEVKRGPGSTSRSAGRPPPELVGVGQAEQRTPYPHQVAAWASLDKLAAQSRRAERSGLVVLPTGCRQDLHARLVVAPPDGRSRSTRRRCRPTSFADSASSTVPQAPLRRWSIRIWTSPA